MELFLGFMNEVLGAIFFFLPDSPFQPVISSMGEWEWLHWLNWFIPVGTFIHIGELWITAIIGYYAYSAVLRFVRAIE